MYLIFLIVIVNWFLNAEGSGKFNTYVSEWPRFVTCIKIEQEESGRLIMLLIAQANILLILSWSLPKSGNVMVSSLIPAYI